MALGVSALIVGAGTGHIEAVGQFVQDFVKSPGLGGIAALVAAIIAYRGIKGQVETSRAALASQQAAEKATGGGRRFSGLRTAHFHLARKMFHCRSRSPSRRSRSSRSQRQTTRSGSHAQVSLMHS